MPLWPRGEVDAHLHHRPMRGFHVNTVFVGGWEGTSMYFWLVGVKPVVGGRANQRISAVGALFVAMEQFI